ncbi:MAG: methionyl-tRNA formyltransferase [Alphaproteobacteria bacterium]|nr:methionyl-tRNA formyltransferase [Alphaproteobacteria bacterium]
MHDPQKLRLGFMGTSEFAVAVLERLLAANIRPLIIYTQPSKARGRGMKTTPTPIGATAEVENLDVAMPDDLTTPDAAQQWTDYALDVAVVVSYGMKLSANFLAAPRFGCVNVHPSLLPRWRGAAPLQRAIEAGDTKGGISIIQMDVGIDTGPILIQTPLAIPKDITGGEWHDHTAQQSANSLIEVLAHLDEIRPQPQPVEGACYARMFTKSSLEIDFHQPAEAVANKIRAFTPKPGAWCRWNQKRLRLFSVKVFAQNTLKKVESGTILDKSLTIQTADGMIQPKLLQLEGRKMMAISDFLLGQHIPVGTILKGKSP